MPAAAPTVDPGAGSRRRTRPMRIRTFLAVVLALAGLTAAAIMTSVAVAAQHAQRNSLATQAGELAASKAGDITIVLRADEQAIRLAATQLAGERVGSRAPRCSTRCEAIGPGPFTVVDADLDGAVLDRPVVAGRRHRGRPRSPGVARTGRPIDRGHDHPRPGARRGDRGASGAAGRADHPAGRPPAGQAAPGARPWW